jgi:hypothetical protein
MEPFSDGKYFPRRVPTNEQRRSRGLLIWQSSFCIGEQSPCEFGIAVVNPQDDIGGQARQGRRAKFARDAIRSQQPTCEFRFVESFVSLKVDTVVRIDVAQSGVIVDEFGVLSHYEDMLPAVLKKFRPKESANQCDRTRNIRYNFRLAIQLVRRV